MNRLLVAMSTLPHKRESSSFTFKLGEKELQIDDCISQLEPVAKYLLNNDELEVVILCTEATVNTAVAFDIDIQDNTEYTAASYFVHRLFEYCHIDDSVDTFAKDTIRFNREYDYGKLKFVFIRIDENELKPGIAEVVKYLKDNRLEEREEFWIDTHGGFRDTAFVLNSIVSLLKVYDIIPDRIVGVRYSDNRSVPSTIVDQRESFYMTEFVAGMNEFIQFGSADSLIDYFTRMGNKNKTVQDLIGAMKNISDGTRLCDPNAYVSGLNQLGNAIKRIDGNEGFLSIFVEYIKNDYGKLLDAEQRTPLDIIERCKRKKLYQQALTFIESLMPEEFYNSKLLYYAEKDKREIKELQIKQKKKYISMPHFVFNSYIDIGINAYTADDLSRRLSRDDLDLAALKVLRERYNDILPIMDSTYVVEFREGSELRVYSNSRKLAELAILLRLHKAIKSVRNITNHASEEFHPPVEDLIVSIEHYLELAEIVFNPDNIEQDEKKESNQIETISTILLVESFGQCGTIRGKTEDGKEALIQAKYAKQIPNWKEYLGKEISVEMNVVPTNGYYYCKPL